MPVALALTSARVHEQRMVLALVEGSGPRAPQVLAADRGYDSKKLRQELRARGIIPSIPARQEPGHTRPVEPLQEASKHRWIVERTHAWMDGWRRLVVRWEHKAQNYLALCILVCCIFCLRRLLR